MDSKLGMDTSFGANRGGCLFLSKVVMCVATLACVGCGGAESTVSGIVTLDGTPVEHGDVAFYPAQTGKGQAASGDIASGGEYTLQAGQTGGLPAGEYLVRVVSRGESIPHPQGGPPTPGKFLLPVRYSDAGTSGLRFEVLPGSNEINLELKTTE
jgi:hypothetical protein